MSSKHTQLQLGPLVFPAPTPPPFPFSSEDAICAHSGIYITYTSKHDCGGWEEEDGREDGWEGCGVGVLLSEEEKCAVTSSVR